MRMVIWLSPLLLYLALSFAFFETKANWSGFYFGYSTDSLAFIWFLNWWPFALSHGLNPFICKYVWFPGGFNFTWAASVPILSLLTWPITTCVSPVLSYNILILSAPACAAWTGFLLARELTKDTAAALVCGFLFGFSGPELGFMLTALNLATTCLIPLGVLLCLRRAQGTLSRWPFIIWFSLLLVVQMGISTEVLATLCVFGAFSWLIFIILAPAAGRIGLWRLAGDIVLSAPLVICLTAPFLYYLVQGLPDVPGQLGLSLIGSADLVRFIFPAIPVHSFWGQLGSILKQFTGATPDHSTAIGLPLTIILILYFYRNIGTSYVRALLGVILLIGLFSLGSVLRFNGTFYPVPMPWSLFLHVPVLCSVIANRFLTYVTLGTALAAACFLAEAKTFRSRVPRYALAGAACLFLIPHRVVVMPPPWLSQPMLQTQTEFKWTRWPVQPFFTPAHVREVLGPAPNVLLLPDSGIGPGMAWQIDAGLGFTQAAGYVGFAPMREMKWGMTVQLALGPPAPNFATVFQAYCRAHRVDDILIGPGTPGSIVSAINALGWPSRMDDGIEIVQPPG
jgi:hypothetical protein